jgi:hypothetical protein
VQQVEQLGCTLKDFYAHHYNALDGSLGPKVAESWTTNLQMLFEELGCTDEQKVRYAALLFTGEALWWWQSKKELLTQELGHGVVVVDDDFHPGDVATSDSPLYLKPATK